MFDDWCNINEYSIGTKKILIRLSERSSGRESIANRLIQQVRSHYDELKQIQVDIDCLGYPGASAILKKRLPQGKKIRSGELGEILGTEFVEFHTGFRIPVRRLRYKDGREVPLRGDDFIGVRIDKSDSLYLLKGKAKSRQNVTRNVVSQARNQLSNDDGRPTPISLLFVADQLMSLDGYDKHLGRKIRDEVALQSVPQKRITHGIFLLSRNDSTNYLKHDLCLADDDHNHLSVNLYVNHHQKFIAWVYEEVGNLGNN